MSANQPVDETLNNQLDTLQSEIGRVFGEVKGVLDVVRNSVVSRQQFESITGSLEERFDDLKKEVDALQIEVMKPAKPWFRDAGVLVSLIAVLFSFGTATASYQQIRAQDRRAMRSELRQLIQRMIALPKENLELTKTYEKDANSSIILSGLINQENSVIARQAADIVDRIPDDVSANEYHAVAFALLNSNSAEKAPPFIERGLSVAKDYSAELELLRLYGQVLTLSGNTSMGRAKYQEALDLFNKYHMTYNPYISMSNAITEMNWASSEFGQGQCKETEKLLSQSKDDLSKMPASPLAELLIKQEANFEDTLQKNRQNCKD
jgi:hypothetical protein